MCILILLCMNVIAMLVESKSLTFGGLFSTADFDQMQYLAVFRMAVNEINNKTDGIYDELLPNIDLQINVHTQCDGIADTSAASLDLANNKVTAVLSALTEDQSLISLGILSDRKIVETFSVAQSSEMGQGWLYPFKTATVPLDSSQGRQLQFVLCYYLLASRIAIFSTNVFYAQRAILDILDESICKLNAGVVQYYSPSPVTTDFTSYITTALSAQIEVFVLFGDPQTTGLLLEQGYDMGLFRPGTIVIGCAEMLSPVLWQAMSSTANVPAILKGLMILKYWPNYYVTSESGQAFVKRWRAQQSTLGTPGHCDPATDDSPQHRPLYSLNNGTVCTGLDFQSFASDGSDLAPYVTTTYDAVVLLAKGLHAVLTANNTALTAESLQHALLHNVSFVGLSGLVEQVVGTSIHWDQGSRISGQHNQLFDFLPDLYVHDANSSSAFAYIGDLTMNTGLIPCGAACPPLVFNSPDGNDVAVPSGMLPYQAATAPSVIKIGLMIESQFDPITGERNMQAVESLAAVQMAINEINNKHDGVADHLLPNSKFVLSVTGSKYGSSSAADAHTLSSLSFGDTGFQGVIAAVPNSYLPALTVFSQLPVVNILTMATDSSLSIGSEFPYKVETMPVDNFEQVVWQDVFCNYFRYTKISIFILSDMIFADMEYCNLEIISMHTFTSSTTDFSSQIYAAKQAGARIFAICTDPVSGGKLLEQGYVAGLFGKDTFTVGISQMVSPLLWQSMSAGADVAAILQSFTVASIWSTYTIDTNATDAMSFVQRWRAQLATVTTTSGGHQSCSHRQDDNLHFYLYHEQLVPGSVSLLNARCSGLDFASYASDGSDLLPATAYAYDAVYTLAMGIQAVLEVNSSSQVSAAELLHAITSNMSFSGATGLMRPVAGDGGLSNIRKGDREVGLHYKILSFNKELFAHDNSSVACMAYVGHWSTAEDFQPCSVATDVNCHGISYRTSSGSFPPDALPPIIVEMSTAHKGVLQAMCSVILAITLFLLLIVVTKRKVKLMKSSQPGMMVIMLCGGVLSVLKIGIATAPITTVNCIAGLWAGHLAFCFGVCTLFMKSWRIDRIINTRSIKRVVVTETGIVLRTLGIGCGALVYLIIMTGVGQPQQGYVFTVSSNQATHYMRCDMRVPAMHTALFALEGLCLLIGVRLCWATRNAPDSVNESMYIARSIVVIFVISAVVFPIVYVLPLTPDIRQFTTCVGFFLVTIIVFGLMFIPKLIGLFMHFKAAVVAPVVAATAAVAGGTSSAPKVQQWQEKLTAYSEQAMKQVPKEDLGELCQHQLSHWQTVLLHLNDDDSSNNNNSSSHSSSTPAGIDPAIDKAFVMVPHAENDNMNSANAAPLFVQEA